jgi:hypothetical protein
LLVIFSTWLVTLTWTTQGLFGLSYFSLFIDVSTCDTIYHLREFMKTTYDSHTFIHCFQNILINSPRYLMRTNFSLYGNNLTLFYFIFWYKNSLYIIACIISCLLIQRVMVLIVHSFMIVIKWKVPTLLYIICLFLF